MAEDNFDPFEEDYTGADTQPRINRSYVSEAAAAEKSLRPAFWSKFTLTRERLTLIGKAFLVFMIIMAYPLMTVMSHQVDDSQVVMDDSRFWAVPDLGVSSILIARELDGPGWVADRHRWHPQARLTALPAWQDSLLSALADHGRLVITQLDDQRDQDLIAAVRLLEPAEGQDMTARLMAASEALSRYDDRVAGGVTAAPLGEQTFMAKLALVNGWAGQKHAALVTIASPGDGWIASEEAVKAVYSAKAVAHVAHEILAATARNEESMLAKYEATDLMQDALNKWRRAATLSPLFVANQSGDAISGLSHPAIMAFRLSEAQRATEALSLRLQNPPAAPATEAEDQLITD